MGAHAAQYAVGAARSADWRPKPLSIAQSFRIGHEPRHYVLQVQQQERALGLPALECTKSADSSGCPDLGYAYQTSGKRINCCALHQGMRYLDYTSNSDNPDEAAVYE